MTDRNLSHLFSQDFTGQEFWERRQRIATEIGGEASALLQGAPAMVTPHPIFRQSKIFYYLSGLEIERCYLLIDGKEAKTTLFVPPDRISGVPGGTLDAAAIDEIKRMACIEEVKPVSELTDALSTVDELYLLHCPDEQGFSTRFGIMNSARHRAADPLEKHERRDEVLAKRTLELFPKMSIEALDPIIEKMRLIKSPAEIAVLRKTGEMAARMCVECMKASAPGRPKSIFEGIGDYVFRYMGNCGAAYDFEATTSRPESATLLDGDLVLVDCGPDYNHYTMDIARMWPINGTFDDWQRHTCGLIAEYHKTLIRLAGPGKLVKDIYEDAAGIMLSMYEGDETGTAILQNMIARGVGYFNHHVGLSVHDAVGSWTDEPFKSGMVVVVDPMVWLENVPHGYVRVEDTIVITDDGCERLTGAAPIELDEIEAVMAEPSGFPAI